MKNKKKEKKEMPENFEQQLEEQVEKQALEPTSEELLILAQKERDEFKDKYLRTLAEFENFRRRSYEEKAGWIKTATREMALKVCDVVDNFERALDNGTKEHHFEHFLDGVKLIYQQLEKVLKDNGVQKIEALGKIFDPNCHEALAHIPSELEKDFVAAVIANGYKMHDVLLRPVMVAVANGEKPKNKEEDENNIKEA